MSYPLDAIPRDAAHAEALYWMQNPSKRKPHELTIKETMVALRVSYRTVQRMVARGDLAASNSWPRMIKRADIEAYLASHPRQLAKLR